MDSLGDRMKGYEQAARTVLPRRMPVILRIDGKAFHTYTKGCVRPFDATLGDVMLNTAKFLLETVQGARFAYTQSDEISLLLHGYKKFDSQPWFDNQVQKMVSVAAGCASAVFTAHSFQISKNQGEIKPAIFDCRAFVVPEAEVCNYFLWRQQDARRNSVQMLARSLYSHHEVERNNTESLKAMCEAKGQRWEDLELRWQRGACVYHGQTEPHFMGHTKDTVRTDLKVPLFGEDRDYVNRHLVLEEE